MVIIWNRGRVLVATAALLLAAGADAKNEFRPLTLSRARKHCPMTSLGLTRDFRPCAASFLVVVPCFGQEKTVMQTLHSIWAQACVKHVIVIDDGPSKHVCARYLLASAEVAANHVEVLRNPYNLGLAGVRNLGLRIADQRKYEFVVFIDADDAFGHGYFHAASKVMHEYDIVTADQVITAVSREEMNTITSASRWVIKAPTLEGLRWDGMLPIPNVLRVSFMRRFGGFVEELVLGMEDYATWVRAIENNARVYKIPRTVGSCYRAAPGSMMRNELYLKLAPSMLKSKAASIMPRRDVCHALHQLANHLAGTLMGTRLEAAVAQQPRQCLGWAWLALWKARVGCTADVLTVLEVGVARCKRAVATNRCTPSELGQVLFVRDFIGAHLQPMHGDAHFDATGFFDACNRSLERSMGSAGLLTSLTLSSVLPVDDDHAAVPPYQPYSYLTPEADAPPPMEPCGAFLDGRLRGGGAADGTGATIPNKVHFIFGLGDDRPYFTFDHHVSVLSASHVHRPEVIMMHVQHEPVGEWWERTRPYVQLVQYPLSSLDAIGGRCLLHYAHRADVLRLRVLQQYGGLYLDLDMVSVRPLSPAMRRASFLIAWQDSNGWSWRRGKEHYGLCNAMMASVPDAPFVGYLLRSYRSFRSYGRDLFWDEHSVRLLGEMVDVCPRWIADGYVTTIESRRVYYPLWNEVDVLYSRERHVWGLAELHEAQPEMLFFHLWTSANKNADFADIRDAVRKYNGSMFGAVVRSVAAKSLRMPLQVESLKLADTRCVHPAPRAQSPILLTTHSPRSPLNSWLPGEHLFAGDKQSCFVAFQADSNLCAYRGSGPENNRGGLWCARLLMAPASLPSESTFAVLNSSSNRMQTWGARSQRDSEPIVQSSPVCPPQATPICIRAMGAECALFVWCTTATGKLVKVRYASKGGTRQAKSSQRLGVALPVPY